MPDRTGILVVGTGAMATLIAARLAAAAVPVTMLGSWKDGLVALQAAGARVVNETGTEQAFPVRATDDPAQCRDLPYAVVLVKSWQTKRVATDLQVCLPLDGLALTLQNGLGNWDLLAEALGAQRTALGVTTMGATLLGPGRVRPGGEGPILLGDHPRIQPLADLFSQAGFVVTKRSDLEAVSWGKVVVNAAINPLTALLGIPNGQLLSSPATRELMAMIAQEVAEVAGAQGLQLPFADPIAAAEDVAQRTASNRSSMLQDIQRGAPTEIDAICGAVVRAGRRLGVPVPYNQVLWLLVQAAVARSLGSPFN